ncbi:response regulator [Aeromonas hydrophila]|uniref:response regulator n=1 Tax=Aeromonas hydrophila TaxID=644 RepID=UPI002890670A|nr:response regulator [Aeromonas dhakensis]
MGTIIIPKSNLKETFLILDDEPEHIFWLVDYIKAQGFHSQLVTNAQEAIDAVQKNKYIGYIIDLNIPLGGWLPNIKSPNPAYDKYRGFYIAKYVRSQGVSGAHVIMYSAHSNDEIKNEVSLLYVDYVAKGRAGEFKTALTQMLQKTSNDTIK